MLEPLLHDDREISIPLRYNLERTPEMGEPIPLKISIPLRYNLECGFVPMSRCPSPYFNSTKVQFRGRRGACWQWSPRISIPLRYNLEGQKCSRCTTRCVISIPLRYNLEGMASQAQQSYHDISIPLRYNLEGEDENIPYQFQTHFNSTKVQFRGNSPRQENRQHCHFNSTKVQFRGRKYVHTSIKDQISIPLRYNLEIRLLFATTRQTAFQFH